MRILHLDSGREMRGGQWQVLRLHGGLIESGIESMLLACEGSPLFRAAEKGSLPIGVLSGRKLRGESKRFDLLHAHDARSHTLAAILSARPFVVSRRVAFPVGGSPLSKLKYRRAARFLAVSRYVAGQLTNAGIDANKVDVVYDGVPVPEFAAIGEAILTSQSDDPGKCMELALSAGHAALVEIKPSDNLERDLPGAKALVYLSRSEGLGSGILLAMAHGVCVVASRIGGIPELIEDGVDGVLTDNKEASIAAALAGIDRRFGTAARLKVMDRFTVRHMVSATIESYRRA